MRLLKPLRLLGASLSLSVSLQAAPASASRVSGDLAHAPERNLPTAERARWFADAKLGCFIHWTPVSVKNWEIGWDWTPKTGEEYRKICREFNPQKFDPDAWVRMMRDAGIRYVVMVAKHHDGYCQWDAPGTDFKTTKAPFATDTCRAVANACKKYGLEFCTYYSIGDIDANGWSRMCHVDGHDAPPPVKGGMPAYLEYVKSQCGDLMKRYGTRNFWFDGFWHAEWYDHPEYRRELEKHLRAINPDVLISRLQMPTPRKGGDWDDLWNYSENTGDYHSREEHGLNRKELALYHEGTWEFCTSPTYHHYSWHPKFRRLRSPGDMVRQMAAVAARNGNYLMNYAPPPDGSLDASQAAIYQGIGAWVKTHGEAIYGTRGGPYLPVGDTFGCTRKGDKAYLLLSKHEGKLTLPALSRKFTAARLLGDPRPVGLSLSDKGSELTLPPADPKNPVTVVELTADGSLDDERLVRL